MNERYKDIPKFTFGWRPGEESTFGDAIRASEKWDIPEMVVVKLASIGSIFTKSENPHQPLLPQENLREVMESIEAGASGIHFNATDPEGKRTGGLDAYRALIEPCKKRFGDSFVVDCNVLFGETIEEQLATVTAGLAETVALAPYNPRKWVEGAVHLMQDHGCKPEIVIHNSGEVELAYRILIKSGILKPPYAWQLLVGVPSIGRRIHSYMPNPRAMCEAMVALVNRIREVDEDPNPFIIVCQSGRATIYLATLAMLMGLHVRVGTEDTMWRYPHRDEIIKKNSEVIKETIEIARLLGRRAATGNEYRKLIGLR